MFDDDDEGFEGEGDPFGVRKACEKLWTGSGWPWERVTGKRRSVTFWKGFLLSEGKGSVGEVSGGQRRVDREDKTYGASRENDSLRRERALGSRRMDKARGSARGPPRWLMVGTAREYWG